MLNIVSVVLNCFIIELFILREKLIFFFYQSLRIGTYFLDSFIKKQSRNSCLYEQRFI